MKKLTYLLLAALVAVSLTACGGGQETSGGAKVKGTQTVAAEGVDTTEQQPLVVDKEAKTVKVFAKLNGKYTVEPTRHGLNFHEGKYGGQALFTSYANQANFHDALMAIGAEAGNNLTPDTAGQTIEGSVLDVTISWEGAPKEYKMTELVLDSTGKPIEYKFGGNHARSIDAFTGCLACFDSCPVGITSNHHQHQGAFADKEVEFIGNKDVLPADGTPVIVTFKLL
ncbi:YdjY domain-containing protein [Ammoniphilus sp. CFH 90114]|uniref:YdjY domain-containing protein n=1 Tax=Ammoniphilus sp. CFH 90114 TaxID=2493665 RepID=UPI00100E63F2|nr:YdjY domain-containing protein [Ammoniphilus sp. CFH 90114]RXT13732.1 hypothetical protein EIZ39_06180 [Ammoniphilus sp. CFH 90114]